MSTRIQMLLMILMTSCLGCGGAQSGSGGGPSQTSAGTSSQAANEAVKVMSPEEAKKAGVNGFASEMDQKLKGGLLQVSGEVANVDMYAVYLKLPAKEGEPDSCGFLLRLKPGDESVQLAQCSPGQKVTLRGEYTTDAEDFRWKIVETGTNPAPIVKATELAAAYAADAEATNKKYADHFIYLVGEISEVVDTEISGNGLKLKGDGDVVLMCYISKVDLADMKVKAGDPVQLLCSYHVEQDAAPTLTDCQHVTTALPMSGVTYAKEIGKVK